MSYYCLISPNCPGNHASKRELCADEVPLDYQIKWMKMHCDHTADLGGESVRFTNREVREAVLSSLKRLQEGEGALLDRIETAAQVLQQAGPWHEIVTDALAALRGERA